LTSFIKRDLYIPSYQRVTIIIIIIITTTTTTTTTITSTFKIYTNKKTNKISISSSNIIFLEAATGNMTHKETY
jgi:hypothetical protein